MKNQNKQFTHEDLEKAINLALKHSNGERDRIEGMRDVTQTILKIFDSAYELKSDSERLYFVQHAIQGLHSGYNQMLYEIDNASVWDEFIESYTNTK